MNKVILILCIGWILTLFKHFVILPCVDWEEHEVTGIEFKIKF